MNGTHLFHLMVWHKGHDFYGKLYKNGLLWCMSLFPTSPIKEKRWLGRDDFPISVSYVSVQIVKIMQITILAPLREENIIKLCSKYFVCFSNYSHVTVNINSCYSV